MLTLHFEVKGKKQLILFCFHYWSRMGYSTCEYWPRGIRQSLAESPLFFSGNWYLLLSDSPFLFLSSGFFRPLC